ncbi:MAG: cell division protein ZapE [Hyphomicrobiaceae bacterium]
MVQALQERYRAMLAAGEIAPDPAQALAVEKLQLLANRLSAYRPPSTTDIFSFFTRKRGRVPEGLYMFGAVGRGKTMLMDLFFATVDFRPKRRLHFHEFMAEAHELIGAARAREAGDPVAPAAREIASRARLICFDELQITDIADVHIIGRLFQALFEEGVVVVATSNARPRDLYRDGLNRDRLIPFIDLIEDRMEVLQLDSGHDYRLEKLAGQRLYFTPADAVARAHLRETFALMTGVAEGERQEIDVRGRLLEVREAHLGTAWFTFEELCARPLGANDYLAIARTYQTVILEGVPVLGPERRNEARRFVTLIDALYDHHVRLILSADAEPDALYPRGDGAHLFERTASRLHEMRSMAYLAG